MLAKFSQNLQIFPNHFSNIKLKSFGLLQNSMKNYEILWKLMKFHKTNEISLTFLVSYFAFIQFWCTLLTFAFTIGAFKSWLQNFHLIQIDCKFQNFGLGNGESSKVNIAVPTLTSSLVSIDLLEKNTCQGRTLKLILLQHHRRWKKVFYHGHLRSSGHITERFQPAVSLQGLRRYPYYLKEEVKSSEPSPSVCMPRLDQVLSR